MDLKFEWKCRASWNSSINSFSVNSNISNDSQKSVHYSSVHYKGLETMNISIAVSTLSTLIMGSTTNHSPLDKQLVPDLGWYLDKMSLEYLRVPQARRYTEVMSKGFKRQCESVHRCRAMTIMGTISTMIRTTNALTLDYTKYLLKSPQTVLSHFKWLKMAQRPSTLKGKE